METIITSFSGTFTAIMNFLTGNPYTLVILGVPLVLGVGGAVIKFIRG